MSTWREGADLVLGQIRTTLGTDVPELLRLCAQVTGGCRGGCGENLHAPDSAPFAGIATSAFPAVLERDSYPRPSFPAYTGRIGSMLCGMWSNK